MLSLVLRSRQQLVEQIFFCFVVVVLLLLLLVAKADAVVVGVDVIDEVVGVVAVAELLLAVAVAGVEWRSTHVCECSGVSTNCFVNLTKEQSFILTRRRC